MVAEAPLARRIAVIDAADAPLLNREQLLDRILLLNPSATATRLAGFDATALRLYLDHLADASRPRAESRGWRRPGDTPAILWREARDA